MHQALGLAAQALFLSSPNPRVGCVLVNPQGQVIGQGSTQQAGGPHAEVMALRDAQARGHATAGATAYVTLEPCAHHGQTPPCAEALIAAGVARVVTALNDPDPRVAGQGHARLLGAGIAVTEGVESEAARAAHAGYLRRVLLGLPAVTLKLALTLDGRIATATGESRWITGPEARRHVHALRLAHDAVLVGGGTARADDPDLSVRDLGAAHQPVRIVIDTRLTLSPDGRLGQSAGAHPVWLCHGPDAPQAACTAWLARGARLLRCAAAPDGRVEATDALRQLAAAGATLSSLSMARSSSCAAGTCCTDPARTAGRSGCIQRVISC
jgi:diaminohydroxyphosphoribosylaminopyrimidine deaminase/5-amino-6-(5-phosphoribosylamino)uracil reductase